MKSLSIGNLTAQFPIVQGGMGVAVSLSGLASAVADQGGIGVISAAAIGMLHPGYSKNFHTANKFALCQEIRNAKNKTRGLIGVNIMMALTDHEELIKVAISENADVLFIGAGLPLKIPQIIKEAGLSGHNTKLIPKVSSAKAANLIFRYWQSKYQFVPDAVVVEGPMAGGHLGFKKEQLAGKLVPLHQLVTETVNIIKPYEQAFGHSIPVIAGGGIHSGKDMFDIMEAGASGVKIGTRFVTTHECDASMAYKMSYINSREEDIMIINSPVGLPGRVVKNNFVQQICDGKTKPFKCPWKCLSSCNYKTAPYCIAKALFNSATGKMDEGFAFAGSNAWKADRITSVADVFKDLISGYYLESQMQTLQFEAELEKQLMPVV